ncbi:MAG: hypothetical protein F4058_06590 [Rhodothermaceae bacterium]|nr:hypothetical protein [Rhodothermaceae bacterium]MYF64041.1 hypothetical protein [Rhodothermaceae bacterium]MYI84990.1 hypothetical protein [Rhodothermaceae bacterium]
MSESNKIDIKQVRDILVIIACVVLIWTFGIYPAYVAIKIQNAKEELQREQQAQVSQQRYEACLERYKDDTRLPEGETAESFCSMYLD